MANISEDQGQPRAQQVSAVVRWVRATYVLVAACFVGAIALQVFLAGASALVHPRYIGLHTTIGHVLQFFPIGLILLSLAGRLPLRLLGLTALTLVLFALQYVFLWVVPSLGIPILRALHAVNALVLFWITLYLAQRVWPLARVGRHPGIGSQLPLAS